ncbi:hypothetical protein JTE90_000956 [Oedothorax gibbosus]|uniref:Uncharacterized protein n=1 Tax=Oedothorax gibbosus TaxID=931172 RepID=A0AAV6TIU9_9ARAC|nr:hypothetical protein JTE90_000956 [Oedothorax gibbosus]
MVLRTTGPLPKAMNQVSRTSVPLVLNRITIATTVIIGLKQNLSREGPKPSSRSLWGVNKSNAWRILLRNDRKSRHRRIKKQRRLNLGCHEPVIPGVTLLTPLA